jgi:hypothetical protein
MVVPGGYRGGWGGGPWRADGGGATGRAMDGAIVGLGSAAQKHTCLREDVGEGGRERKWGREGGERKK